ncbi:hypothetical protein C1H76_4233 [Elsinoe australis]|uniref:Uncharacterized protein n=1 Tax=Elsinoe australis TaxID=40998 RepID=A0A4U7B4M8_9PEZI|nr:hypothetical protein C1H76_4233 [Elsinoe australis]
MDLFQDVNTPTYYIYRDGASTEAFDPTSPLQFFPPKDSDELFFALRTAFPHVATHSERMRNAVIEFLMNEGQAQVASAQTSPLMPMDSTSFGSTTGSPYSPYISMTSSSSSSDNSPRLSAPSPAVQAGPIQRTQSQSSVAPSQSGGLDQMTSVFSLTSHAQPKMRTRRKMTEAEKAEYRKRRSAGACKSCSARKRKCKHNGTPSAPTSTAPTVSSQRVLKPLTKKQGKQAVPETMVPAGTMPLTASGSLISFDNTSLNAPGDLISFNDNELFPWQPDADWTLLDFEDPPVLPQWGNGNPYALEVGSSSGMISSDPHTTHTFSSRIALRDSEIRPVLPRDSIAPDHNVSRSAGGRADYHFVDPDSISNPTTLAQQPTHTLHTHAAQSPRSQPDTPHDLASEGRTTGPTIATGSDAKQKWLSYYSSGSGPGRGDVDGGHDFNPTRVATIFGSGLYGFDRNARDGSAVAVSSGLESISRHAVTSGSRASEALLSQDTLDRSHSATLQVSDAVAASPRDGRQSLTNDRWGLQAPKDSHPQDSSGLRHRTQQEQDILRRESVGTVSPATNSSKHSSTRPQNLAAVQRLAMPTAPHAVNQGTADHQAPAGLQDLAGHVAQEAAPVHTRPTSPRSGSATSSGGSLGGVLTPFKTKQAASTSATPLATQSPTTLSVEADRGPLAQGKPSNTMAPLSSQSFAGFGLDGLDTQVSLETFLKQLGEIQFCLLCSLLHSLIAVRVPQTDATATPAQSAAIDDLTSMCSKMQLVAV